MFTVNRNKNRRLIRLKNKIRRALINFITNVTDITGLPLALKLKLINAEPDRPVIWVDLESIQYFVPNKDLEELFYPNEVTKSKIPLFFFSGNWDHYKLSIDKFYSNYSVSYRSVYQIFVKGINYKQTDEYIKLLDKINKTNSSPRGTTVDELNYYYQSLFHLNKSIKKNGYKSQEQLNGNNNDEIGVFIGRNGEIIKAEDNFSGTHRFALAKILSIKKIPVHVLAIHYEWAIEHIHLLGVKNKHKLEKYLQI